MIEAAMHQTTVLREMRIVDLETGALIGLGTMPSLWDWSRAKEPSLRSCDELLLGERLPSPMTGIVAYSRNGELHLRLATSPREEEVEVVLPRRIPVRPGQDLRRLFFEECNPSLAKPLVAPYEHQYKNIWIRGDERPVWHQGSCDGQRADLDALVRTVLWKHDIACENGLMLIWLSTRTRDHLPKFALEPFEPVRRGDFASLDQLVLEEIGSLIAELEPGLIARNHPSFVESRRSKASKSDTDLFAPYRAANMEEIGKLTTIPVEGAPRSMHDVIADTATVEEIRAEAAKQTAGG